NPEAAGGTVGGVVGWEGAGEGIGMAEVHVVAGPGDLEGAVEGEEGLEQILLAPEAAFHDPFFVVLGGEEDVVEVDGDSGLEAGEDFEDFVVDVAADVQDVGGVDEENVVGFEL